MKKQLTYIAPLKAGIVLAVLYTVGGLIGIVIALPFLMLARAAEAAIPTVGMGWLLALPIGYGIVGFAIGILFAALYNVVAKFTGGLEFGFKDVPAGPSSYTASVTV
jgi:hypothetical protein